MSAIQSRIFHVLVVASLVGACAQTDSAGDAAADDSDARMAAEHANDVPTATAAASTPPAAEVTAQRVEYGTLDGASIQGFLVQPAAGAPKAGLVVIHEWWGLNENVEAMARRFAAEGYLALAVDLYGGEVAAEPEAARALMGGVAADPARAEANLRQAHDFLASRTEAIGVIGWCFGGGWSLRTAVMFGDDIDAAVMYYGRVITDGEALAGLSAPLLGHFASEDRGILIEDVRAMDAALVAAGKVAEVHVYDGAEHAFANPSGTRYNAEAAELAWSRTTAFLADHLGF